jgi:cation:H+ antiporter
MLVSIIIVILGFASLIFAANWLVDGASALAKKYKISDLAIGLTIVAFGTSAPELVVNIIGSMNGYSDIVVGNIIGSNNFNLFIILGISGLILPISVQSSTAWKEIPISLLVAIILIFFINDFNFSEPSYLSRLDSLIMLVMFVMFLYYVFRQMKNDSNIQADYVQKSTLKIWGLILIGLSGLIIGGQLVVVNSVKIANSLGVSEKIIGLTIVAAGTSLPELVTSIVAATKRNSDIAIGNVIGSNIFNILLILSISGLIMPIEYNPKFNLDIYILIGGTMFLLIAMITGQRKKLDRWEAGILLGFYLFYTTYLVMKEI